MADVEEAVGLRWEDMGETQTQTQKETQKQQALAADAAVATVATLVGEEGLAASTEEVEAAGEGEEVEAEGQGVANDAEMHEHAEKMVGEDAGETGTAEARRQADDVERVERRLAEMALMIRESRDQVLTSYPLNPKIYLPLHVLSVFPLPSLLPLPLRLSPPLLPLSLSLSLFLSQLPPSLSRPPLFSLPSVHPSLFPQPIISHTFPASGGSRKRSVWQARSAHCLCP